MAKKDITTLSGADPDEASEYHGEIEWKPFSSQEIADQFAEYIPCSDDAAERPYTTIDQFLGAAQGQPGVAFGFRAGVGLPKCYLKFEDGDFFLGTAANDGENFAAIDGNDGDNDDDDLAIYPSPGGGGPVVKNESRNEIARIVESLLKPAKKQKRDLSEAEVNRIALSLLES
jgi:hypothetical protein